MFNHWHLKFGYQVYLPFHYVSSLTSYPKCLLLWLITANHARHSYSGQVQVDCEVTHHA